MALNLNQLIEDTKKNAGQFINQQVSNFKKTPQYQDFFSQVGNVVDNYLPKYSQAANQVVQRVQQNFQNSPVVGGLAGQAVRKISKVLPKAPQYEVPKTPTFSSFTPTYQQASQVKPYTLPSIPKVGGLVGDVLYNREKFSPSNLAKEIEQADYNVRTKVFNFGPNLESPTLPPTFQGAGAGLDIALKNSPMLARVGNAALGQAGKIKLGPDAPVFKEASNYIASRIGEPVTKKVSPGILSNLKEKLIDSFSPIEDAINAAEKQGGFKLLPTQDPRLLRNRLLGSTGIANQSLKQGLEPIVKQVGSKNLDQFDQYLAARQALDVGEKGFETGIDPKKARTFVDTLAPQYEALAQQVTGYTQKILKFVTDGGLISKETYDYLTKKYPNYVPLNRVFDIVDNGGLLNTKSVGSLSKQTVVKGLKGSERQISSPLASIIDKVHTAVNEVERNRIAQSIAGLRKLPNFAEDIKPVKEAAGKPTISVFENGKKTLYQVPEEFEIAAKNLNHQQTNILIKAASIPVRIARLGITGVNIPFVATNIVRDQLFSTITSSNAAKTSLANPYNWIKAFYDSIKGGGLYDDFLASGGGWGEFFRVGRQQGKATLKDMTQGTGEKVIKTIADPRKWLSTVEELVSRVGETPSRVQQFGGTLEAMGGKGTKVDPLAAPTRPVLEAAKAARENSTDFAKKGAYGDVLNSVFIYLNAGIQGSRTALRAIKTNPAGTSAKIATTLFMPVTAATLWNTATPERKAAYDAIPEWEKSNFLIILPPNPTLSEDGTYTDAIKVPLPFNFSALAIPVRKSIEQMAGLEPLKLQDALASFLGFVSPFDIQTDNPVASATNKFIPTAIVPFVEASTNTKLYSGRPIVGQGLQRLEPAQQYYENTPGIFKELGQAFNVSPLVLENFVRGYGGGTAQQVANLASGNVEGATVEPFKKRFTQVSQGATTDKFYEEMDKFSKTKATALNLIKTQPDSPKTKEYVLDHLEEIQKAKGYEKVGDYLSDIRKKKIEIASSKLSGDDKVKALRALNELSNNLVLFALQSKNLNVSQSVQEELPVEQTLSEESNLLQEEIDQQDEAFLNGEI